MSQLSLQPKGETARLLRAVALKNEIALESESDATATMALFDEREHARHHLRTIWDGADHGRIHDDMHDGFCNDPLTPFTLTSLQTSIIELNQELGDISPGFTTNLIEDLIKERVMITIPSSQPEAP